MAKQEHTLGLTQIVFADAGAGVFGVYHENPDVKAKVNAKAKAMLEDESSDFEEVLITAAASLIFLIGMDQASNEEAAP